MNTVKIFKGIIILLILSLVLTLGVSCMETKEDKIVLEEFKILTLDILALQYLPEEVPKDVEERIKGAKSSLDLLEEIEKLYNNWLKEAETKDEEIKGLKDELKLTQLDLLSCQEELVEVRNHNEEFDVPVELTPNSVTDKPGDWFDWESMKSTQGPEYTDIDFAEVTIVGSDVVFMMELGGNIPYPETFIPEVSELENFFALCPLPGFEEWPWYSPAYDGLECLPNAFIILIYENGSWRFAIDYSELGEIKTVILPEDNLHVEENTITMKASLEALGNPSSFKWLAGTYIDGIADIAPNEGSCAFEVK